MGATDTVCLVCKRNILVRNDILTDPYTCDDCKSDAYHAQNEDEVSDDYFKGWEDGLDRASCELRARREYDAQNVVDAIPRDPAPWSGTAPDATLPAGITPETLLSDMLKYYTVDLVPISPAKKAKINHELVRKMAEESRTEPRVLDWNKIEEAANRHINTPPPCPNPDRTAWLLTALGSFGRISIQTEQYEELRGLALSLETLRKDISIAVGLNGQSVKNAHLVELVKVAAEYRDQWLNLQTKTCGAEGGTDLRCTKLATTEQHLDGAANHHSHATGDTWK